MSIIARSTEDLVTGSQGFRKWAEVESLVMAAVALLQPLLAFMPEKQVEAVVQDVHDTSR